MLAATASAVARLKESGMLEATTVANFKVKSELQAVAAGRVIWCDEASLLDNADMTWLLNFARNNGSRLVVSGDPRQHGAVQRGHPFKMAIDTAVLPCAKLQKIYRQQNAPQLLEIIEDYYAQRYDAALQKIEGLGLIRESNTRTDSLQALVADVIEEFKRGQNPLVISPIHRDGKAFAQSLRASMKAEGMLGQDDHEVAWLESVDLSAAQQRDPIYYEPGQIIEFHRQREKGGFRCGDHWEVTRREDQAVFVVKDGKERQLPLHLAQDFNVYRAQSMPVAVGERVLITKNNRKASLTNGDLLEVKAIDQTGILLENGRRLERSKPLHIRQGYTITSQTSQGHERAKMFGFLPVSATSQINAVQMLVSLSRASQEVRLYTDSSEVLKEVAIRPGQGRSAVELIDGVAMPRNDSSTGHDEKELAQELAQKDPSLSSAQEAPLEKEIQEAVMKHQKILQETPPDRAISSPSPATAKTRSNTGTRDQQGFLTQKKSLGTSLFYALTVRTLPCSRSLRPWMAPTVPGSLEASRTTVMSKRTRGKKSAKPQQLAKSDEISVDRRFAEPYAKARLLIDHPHSYREWNILDQYDVPGFFYLESRFRLNPGEQPAIYTAFELCLHECQFERLQV